MISNKLSQLKQDLVEVNGKFEDVQLNAAECNIAIEGYDELVTSYKDLKEAIETLDKHLKDHIEDVEIFIGRIN
ncbi:MAG: hypothetical protein LIR50_05790 [Bacillota bacterium]|nr:hypothetical protein [Bacillota bacterium]